MKLSRLIDTASEVSGQSYSYVSTELDISVTIRMPKGLAKEDVPALLSHVLASRGFTTVRSPGSPLLTVVKIDQAAGLASSSNSDGAAFVTELLDLKHQPAKAITEAVRGLLSKPGGSVATLGGPNTLAISDLAPRVAEVKAMIARLDVPDHLITREIPLQFVQAAQASAIVTQLVSKRESSGGHRLLGDLISSADGSGLILICPPEVEGDWRDLVQIADRRDVVESRTYSPRFFAAKDVARLVESTVAAGGSALPDDRFKIVVDDLMGSLIITGTAAQHTKIGELLERLDSADRSPTPVRAFPIKNRPVSELLTTLRELIAAGALDAESSGASRSDVTAGASQSSLRTPPPPPTGGTVASNAPSSSLLNAPAPTPTRAPAQSGTTPSKPQISLTADESTNTLIAIGEPRLLSQLESLIQTLDRRQPQVLMEVLLVSMTESEALSLGVELERIASLGNATLKLGSLFGLSNGGPASGTVGAGAGFNGSVLNQGEYGAVIRALETVNQGRSLSRPQLLVSNNEKAVFSSVLQQPITQQTRTGSNDTTFSYGGSESAGTTISVRPQIAQGDHLVLTYSIKLSSFVGASTTPGLPPPKQENSVDSVATIPDGHTVVVGGVDFLSDSNGESRLPLLGRLPVVGNLFKNQNDSNSRSRFFVFIRATVLRNNGFEDLKFISGEARGAAKVEDGWPVVKARMIR